MRVVDAAAGFLLLGVRFWSVMACTTGSIRNFFFRYRLCAPWFFRPGDIYALLAISGTVCTRRVLIIALELHGCQLFLTVDGDGWELAFLRRQKEHAFGARRLLCRPISCILGALDGLQPRNAMVVHINGETVCL